MKKSGDGLFQRAVMEHGRANLRSATNPIYCDAYPMLLARLRRDHVALRAASRRVDTALPNTPFGWYRRILSLSWPAIVANLTIPLVGVADVAVMGRLPGPMYIGAVAVGSGVKG